jgi:uncharacterized protein
VWRVAPFDALTLSPETISALRELGVRDVTGLVPSDVFAWTALATLKGFVPIAAGGFGNFGNAS